MATQTQGQVQTEIKDRIAIFEELLKFASVNSSGSLSNYIAREETAIDDPEGDYSTLSNQALKTFRSLLAQAIDGGSLASILDPLWLNYAKVVGNIVETDGPGIIRRLYLWFIANNLTVNSRGISYGSVSAGSNLGDGTINRLTVDAYGFNLEACHMETKKFECIFDQDTGAAKAEEIFRVRGETRQVDQLYIDGSGALLDIAAFSSRKSIVTNASFSQFSSSDGGLTALEEISGWTPGSGADTFTNLNLSQTASEVYRGSGGTSDPTPTSLKFLASEYITQAFSLTGAQLDPDVPIYGQLAWKRGTGVGTLIFTMGNTSVSVAIAAQSGWNLLRLPLTKMAYPRNFAVVDNITVKVQWIGTGTIFVDDLCIGPMAQIDGTWVQIVGGATPFVGSNRDSFSYTDALSGADAVIQKWLWRIYGLHLPYNAAGGETWTDPTV